MYYVLSDYTIHVTGKGMPGPARYLKRFNSYADAQAWIDKRTGVKPGKNKYA